MKQHVALSIMFLLLCALFSVGAINAKVEQIKVENKYFDNIEKELKSLEDVQVSGVGLEAWQTASIRSLDQRVVNLSNRDYPSTTLRGNAYCVMMNHANDSVTFDCKRFT